LNWRAAFFLNVPVAASILLAVDVVVTLASITVIGARLRGSPATTTRGTPL
jgi:hypothetical protein